MTIAKDFVAKLAVAFVAVAMVLVAYAPAAQAQTTEELQAMINDLLAQIASLESGSGDAMASGVCPYTWTRDLSSGSTGMDVMKLQQFLNSDADTRVAVDGAGSPGNETEYYGPATAAAVSKMQVKYRADILSPANLVNPTGYFGPSSRAKANMLCVAAPAMDDTMDDADDTMDDAMDDSDDSDDSDNGELQGEASLDVFEVDDPSKSDISEGDEDVEIGVFTIEFDNGDAEISRIDLALVGSNGSAEPWEAFETISLWVDGDKVAEENADDEDDYLDEDDGSLRFSGLDLVGREGDEVEVTVAASVQNNLDDAELDDGDGDDWDLFAHAIRFFDADGVATTETDFEDVDNDNDGNAAEFDIEEEGEGEELDVSLASDSPDSADIVVDEDDETDDVTVMIFELEAEEGDLEIDSLVVRVDTPSGTTTDIVDDVYLTLDGQTFDAEAVGDETDNDVSADQGGGLTGVQNGKSEMNGTTSVWYFFDIDGDVTVEEDEEMEVEVSVDLKSQSGNFSNGQLIEANISSTESDEWDVEGSGDFDPTTDVSGAAAGDQHTLVAMGILVPVDSVSASESTSGDNDQTGSFSIDFDVTAVEGDFYVFDAVTEGAFNSTSTGVTFSVDGPTGFSATSSGVLTSTADEDTAGVFTVREGQTETFTMTVTVDTDTSGNHRVNLTGVGYSDDTTQFDADDTMYQPVPVQDFRTDYINVNAN